MNLRWVHQQKGMSLVELAVASGIMLTLAFAMTQMTLDMHKNVDLASRNFDILQLQSRVMDILRDKDNCRETLNVANELKPYPEGVQFEALKRKKPADPTPTTPWSGDDFYTVAKKYGSDIPAAAAAETLREMRFVPDEKNPDGTLQTDFSEGRKVYGKLYLLAHAAPGRMPAKTAEIDLEVEMGSDKKIKSCSASGGSEGAGTSYGRRVFSDAGTFKFAVPEGVTQLTIEVVGAGGGGAGVTLSRNYKWLAKSECGAGGGSGAFVKGKILVKPGAALEVRVGKGGKSALPTGDTSIPTNRKAEDGGDSRITIDGTDMLLASGGRGARNYNYTCNGGGCNGWAYCSGQVVAGGSTFAGGEVKIKGANGGCGSRSGPGLPGRGGDAGCTWNGPGQPGDESAGLDGQVVISWGELN
jgi:hypothetical protein